MFSSTKTKKATAIGVLAMMFMGLGAAAALADDEYEDGKMAVCHVPPGNPDNAHTIWVSPSAVPAHLAHGDKLGECDEENGEEPPGGEEPGEGEDCETISIEIEGIELDICVIIDLEVELDELLDLFDLLSDIDSQDRLDWLFGRLYLGDRLEWLKDKVDLHYVFWKLGWLKHHAVPGLLGFVGGTVFHLLGPVGGILDGDVLDGGVPGGGGGEGDCSGLVVVCNNANNLNVEDVVNVCSIEVDQANGQGDDANNDCDVLDLGYGPLSGEGLLGLDQIGDVLELVNLF